MDRFNQLYLNTPIRTKADTRRLGLALLTIQRLARKANKERF